MSNKKKLTLAFICKDGKVLLGLKKRGFGINCWNGFGGKIEEGETIEQAAIREVQEEVGINVEEMKKIGILQFQFEGDREYEVYVYQVNEFSGEPQETDEMKPRWFDQKKLPINEMWGDDIYWYPLMFENKKFRGKFLFSQDNKVLSHEVWEVNSF